MNMKKMGLLVLATAFAAAPCFAEYSYRVVDYPGAARTRIFATNNLGQFVGAFWDASGAAHALFFDGRRLTPLDPDGLLGKSPASWAYSLNDRGQIAGRYQDASGKMHGYLFHRGHTTTIDFPGAMSTEAYGVNDREDVIGIDFDSTWALHAFVMRNGAFSEADLPGSMTIPLSINDRGQIVGELIDVPGTVGHGYLQSKNGDFRTFDAPSAPPNSTYFISINNRDEILGQYFPAGGYQNFILVRGEWLPFAFPVELAPFYVSPQTLNDRGDVVGWFDDAHGEHGFVAAQQGRRED